PAAGLLHLSGQFSSPVHGTVFSAADRPVCPVFHRAGQLAAAFKSMEVRGLRRFSRGSDYHARSDRVFHVDCTVGSGRTLLPVSRLAPAVWAIVGRTALLATWFWSSQLRESSSIAWPPSSNLLGLCRFAEVGKTRPPVTPPP